MAAAEEPQKVQRSYPLQVHYCGVCTMPLEYCEYGGELKKCREWLQTNLPEVYEELMGGCDPVLCVCSVCCCVGAGTSLEEEGRDT